MDPPLAPVCAKTFMSYQETEWLNKYNFNNPEFYSTHVDDIFLAASSTFKVKSL